MQKYQLYKNHEKYKQPFVNLKKARKWMYRLTDQGHVSYIHYLGTGRVTHDNRCPLRDIGTT